MTATTTATAAWWKEFFQSGAYTVLQSLPEDLTRTQVAFAQRALDLRPGMAVLDIACGVGRHSAELARLGMDVVGLDYTPDYLEQARTRCAGLNARFVEGDMRSLPMEDETFDAAVIFFNSFGYFEDEEDDRRVLREAARVLRAGGGLLLDILHRDGMARAFAESRREPFASDELREERHWDPRTGRISSSWTCIDRSGQMQTLTTSNRIYTCGEVTRMLDDAGFEIRGIWGDWDGSELRIDHQSMLIAARKRPEGTERVTR